MIQLLSLRNISIHAPREGSDGVYVIGSCPQSRFQSTLPVRGATEARPNAHALRQISIHAPREGSDRGHGGQRNWAVHFNPRSP